MDRELTQVRIGIAEGALLLEPGALITAGLGSCVGLVLFDTELNVAGMVHIMLPTSPQSQPLRLHKYANTAIPWLYSALMDHGASPDRICAKFAGGAQMFRNLQSDVLRIGDRNAEMVSAILEDLHIPVVACDTGGDYGRTVRFELPSRILNIRTAQGDERQI